MATWSDTLYMHPWYQLPSLKRKTTDDDGLDNPFIKPPTASLAEPSSKRRRCDTLERSMTSLSLYSTGQRSGQTQTGQSTLPLSFDDHPDPSRYSEMPEEPTYTPHTLDAAGPSAAFGWYEPEKDRIVVTSLDVDIDLVEEDPSPENNPTIQVNISPALLDRLTSYEKTPLPPLQPPLPEPSADNALVLYKPLTLHVADGNDVSDDDDADDGLEPIDSPLREDDAMDVEL